MTYPCNRCNMDEGSPICLQYERCQRHEHNAYGPEHLAPKPAPGLAFDARGVLAPIERESVGDALMIVESYGPWGADLNDAHRRQIVLADEVKRMTGFSEALQAEWDRECGDTDKILRALGLDPANCRTDGGSLKLRMLLGALEHRDVMIRREAKKKERERCAAVCDTIAQQYKDDSHGHAAERAASAIRLDQP